MIIEKALSRLARDDRTEPRKGVPGMLSRSLRAIRSHLGMDVAFVSEFTDDRRYFRYVDSGERKAMIKVGDSNPLEDSFCQRVVDGRLPELMADACANAEALTLPVTRLLGIGAHLSVPVRVGNGRVFGTFCCFSLKADHSLTVRDLATMRVFADMMAEQIEEEFEAGAERRSTNARMDAALQTGGMSTMYQPIFNLREGRVVGFEALSRFQVAPHRPPNLWFDEAVNMGRGVELERHAIVLALEGLRDLPDDVYLSLNASPDSILRADLSKVMCTLPLHRIVLEVTEHQQVEQYREIAKIVRPLRQAGMRVAVDDAGAGYACFQHILNLAPDMIKLDISISHDIDTDPHRRALATALCTFAAATQSTIVAEGVETAAELAVLRSLGVTMAQGYFLGRPLPIAAAVSALAPVPA